MNGHVIDDLEAYALGALDDASAERIASHLALCPACREDAAALAEVVGTLPESVDVREPRPQLRERLLTTARADLATPRPARRVSLGSVRPWRLAFTGLAAAVLVLGVADLGAYRALENAAAERDKYYSLAETLREGGRVWYMAGKDAFRGSGGTLFDPRADGKQPFVLFHDLPSIPTGKVLTVWLVSGDGTWARAATFAPDGHDIQTVQISMSVTGFDRCAVTLEDSAWGARYGPVVMESRIAPPAAAQ